MPRADLRSLGALGLLSAAWAMLCWRLGPPQGDFANYYTAASLWWSGADLAPLYDLRFFNDHAARLGFGDRLSGFPVLTPPSALLAAPLLALSAAEAGRVWWMLQCVLGWLTGAVVARSLGRPLWWGIAALPLVLPALRGHLIQGQFHLPAVLALALGLWGWRAARPLATGLSWGLAIGLKVHAWPLLLVLALARRWRALTAAMLTLALGGAGSLLLLGWPLHAVWLAEIAPASSGGWFTNPWHVSYQSSHQLTRALLSPHLGLHPEPPWHAPQLASALSTALHLGAVAATAAHGLRWPSLTAGHRQRLLAAAAIVAMVTGPILATYHLVLLLPPVLWAADALWRSGSRGRAVAVLGLTLLAGYAPTPTQWPDGLAMLAAVPRFWALLALWVLILPWSRRAGAASALGVLLAVLLAASGGDRGDPAADGARPIDGPGFPLISADLLRTDDGALWFAGIRQDRDGWPGAGGMGFRLAPGAAAPEVVAADASMHVWSPQATGPDSVAWTTGPDGDPTPSAPCRGGMLTTARIDGFAQVVWRRDGKQRVLTTAAAHHADPVCDAEAGVAYFLSDRGAGVRALRLWQVALP